MPAPSHYWANAVAEALSGKAAATCLGCVRPIYPKDLCVCIREPETKTTFSLQITLTRHDKDRGEGTFSREIQQVHIPDCAVDELSALELYCNAYQAVDRAAKAGVSG